MAGPYNPPIKNVSFTCYVSLKDLATPGTLRNNPTLASGDVKVSIDGGAFTNIDAGGTAVPTVTPASSVAIKLVLTAAEMNGDNIVVTFIDQTNPKEWADYMLNIVTTSG